MDEGL